MKDWNYERYSTHLPLPRLSGNNFLSFGWQCRTPTSPLTSWSDNAKPKRKWIMSMVVVVVVIVQHQNYILRLRRMNCERIVNRASVRSLRECRCSNPIRVYCYVGRTQLSSLKVNVECCWTHIHWSIIIIIILWITIHGTVQNGDCDSVTFSGGACVKLSSVFFLYVCVFHILGPISFRFFKRNIRHWVTTAAHISHNFVY